MKKTRWIAVLAVLSIVVAACGGDGGTTTTAAEAGGATAAEFTLFGAPTGVEGEALEGFIDVYNAETGSNITFTGSDDMESQLRIRVDGGDPPAVAAVPQPGSICDFATDGPLVSLETMGFDIAQMEADHSKYWMDLGLCDGQHYGIPWFPNFKSIVFYHEPTFTAQGYEIPETWDDMMALSQQVVDDGMTPWCFGFETGGASGWPGTDWLEDILVRQSGGDVYNQWVNHQIPFNDPAVVSAFDRFGELIFSPGFVLGGAENIAGVNVNDSPGPLFTDPEPGCLMFKQGSFAANWFSDTTDYDPGEEAEIKVFPFPSIDGNVGAMGGGDTLIVFDGSPENVQVVKDWVSADWGCTLASETGGGIAKYGGHGVSGVERLPGNANIDPNCYDTETGKAFATTITGALASNSFVFDASDLMPPAVGQGSFWTAMLDFTRGATSKEVTDTVENSWP